MKTISADQFKKTYGDEAVAMFPEQPAESSPAKEFGVGFFKGAGSTLQGIQDLGQRTIAAVDPTRTYEEVKKNTGIDSLENADLAAKTPYEKAGKAIEFVAEVLFPVGAATKADKILASGIDNLAERASSLGDDIVEGGVKVKDKIIQLANNLDDKTKTALKRTNAAEFRSVVDQGRKAIADDRVRTPIEKVGDTIIEGLDTLKARMNEIGEKKSSFLQLPDAFSGDGIKAFNEGLARFMNSRTVIENDKPIVQKIVDQFKGLGLSPTKGQVDKFIDYAQEQLYSGQKNLVQPMSDKTVAGLQNLVGQLNTKLKKQLPAAYQKLNDEYSRLIRISNEINTNLGKEGRSAGAFVKRLFSPSDARTKFLFEELQKITGKDYFKDARLAKFVMETLGDTRVESILEQIPKSSTDTVNKVMKWVMKKTGINDPIKAAEEFIKTEAID